VAKVLIVGAGFAGAVHARCLAEAGYDVTVIDKRPHIAGNCFDEVHNSGVRIHRYGPHLFHTSNKRVVNWLSRFTDWEPYEHRVVARLPDGRTLPLPVNLDTVNGIYGLALKDPVAVAAHLRSVSVQRDPIANAEDWLYANLGRELTNLFFRPYTLKMWGLDLRDLSEDVVRRVKIRFDREDRYFPDDSFQAMPADGYTSIFERIFDHAKIDVQLSRNFSHDMTDRYCHCFNSMPIDEYFEFEFGELPYRSIRFHLSDFDESAGSLHTTINYTDSGPLTRETWWHNIPNHHIVKTGIVSRTIEEPCDYKDNNLERYYPLKTPDGRFDRLYEKYKDLATRSGDVSFIGRCGTYQYLDMHQVINQSLLNAEKWIDSRRA
jgi:UDP-galactopyranose mutase